MVSSSHLHLLLTMLLVVVVPIYLPLPHLTKLLATTHPFPAKDGDDDLEYKSSEDEKVRHYLRSSAGRELLQGPLMDTGYRCDIHCMSGEGKCDQKCHVNSVTEETSCASGHLPGICQFC